ncbi:MAG: HD domain-containing protein [Alphaproteobacteria bacterium]|nr:MAG: HD domain-containing protein [Alphaproteobacteria bacterium]
MPSQRDEILRCLFQTVGTMVDAAGREEAYAPGHRLKTSQIARTIAQIIRCDDDVVDGVRMAATLHDFGNILIPVELLTKPGKFTDEEFALIKQHATYGAEILKDIEFPWPICNIILMHHERIDGSGYPAGLKGTEVMMEAQILGVADMMEAMTSPRPWRAALSVEEALSELTQMRGVKFEAYIVDAAIELFTKQKYRLDPEYYGRT